MKPTIIPAGNGWWTARRMRDHPTFGAPVRRYRFHRVLAWEFRPDAGEVDVRYLPVVCDEWVDAMDVFTEDNEVFHEDDIASYDDRCELKQCFRAHLVMAQKFKKDVGL